LSVLGFSGYHLILVPAVRDAGVEASSLIIGTIPIWVMVLGKPEGLRWQDLLPGLILTITGVVLMMMAGHTLAFPLSIGLVDDWTYWRGWYCG
jgi:drug/metabolite transporter (DMT)-like permease